MLACGSTEESVKQQQQYAGRSVAHLQAVDASLLGRAASLPLANPKPVNHYAGTTASSAAAPPANSQPRVMHISQFSGKVELYKGSVSTVYQAQDDWTRHKVILKCYHKKKMQDKHYHKLDREIKAMVALRGPFVAELHGWFEDEEAIWLSMELCEGGDLFKLLGYHGGRLDEHYVCTEIIAPLLRVLEKSHCLALMHRDIKPENIFLTRHHKFRLGDWGLALNWQEELPFSRSGTLDYMAPEVLRNPASHLQESAAVSQEVLAAKGIRPYDEKVDVWAVGVLAYELVVGKPPFEVEDEAQTATLIMYSNDIRFPPQSSQLWADFVRSVLVKDPARRPSASQLMSHQWITAHLHKAMCHAAAQGRVSSREVLLRPLPLTREERLRVQAQAGHPWITAAMARMALDAPENTQRQQQQQQQQQVHQHQEYSTPTRPMTAQPQPPATAPPAAARHAYAEPTLAQEMMAHLSTQPQQQQQQQLHYQHHQHAQHQPAHIITGFSLPQVSSAPSLPEVFTPPPAGAVANTLDRARSCAPLRMGGGNGTLPSAASTGSFVSATSASSFEAAAAAIAAAAGSSSGGGASEDRTSAGGAHTHVTAHHQHAHSTGAPPAYLHAHHQHHGLPRPPSASTRASPLSRPPVLRLDPATSLPQYTSHHQQQIDSTATLRADTSVEQLLGMMGADGAIRVTRATPTKSVTAAPPAGLIKDGPLRSGLSHMQQPHLQALKVPAVTEDSSGYPASPAPPAGFKQRSLHHLQRQHMG